MNENIKEMIATLGINKTMVMVGGKDAVYNNTNDSISFKFKGSRDWNYVEFRYNKHTDLYDLTLMKLVKFAIKKRYTWDGLYVDQVNKVFESHTGLYTRLF